MKAHWCTQQTTRPDTAFFAPRGVEQVMMRESRYGSLVGQYSYRLKSPADDQDEEEEGELDKAIADARRPNGKLMVELELNNEQARRCIAFAMQQDACGAQRTRKAGDPRGTEGEKFKPFDAALLPRMAINGDALPGHTVRALAREMQEQIYSLRVQLAYERNWTNGRAGKEVFEMPVAGVSKMDREARARDRASRRTLETCDAHLNGIWHLVDKPDGSSGVEGMENYLACLICRGMPGSGARHDQRWVTRRLASLLWANPHFRKRMEICRRMTKLWAPAEILASQRKGHVGQRQLRAMRRFATGQIWGNEKLLQAGRERPAAPRWAVKIQIRSSKPGQSGRRVSCKRPTGRPTCTIHSRNASYSAASTTACLRAVLLCTSTTRSAGMQRLANAGHGSIASEHLVPVNFGTTC